MNFRVCRPQKYRVPYHLNVTFNCACDFSDQTRYC